MISNMIANAQVPTVMSQRPGGLASAVVSPRALAPAHRAENAPVCRRQLASSKSAAAPTRLQAVRADAPAAEVINVINLLNMHARLA